MQLGGIYEFREGAALSRSLVFRGKSGSKTNVTGFKLVSFQNILQSCDERNIANKKCDDCDEFLCDDCVKAHKRVKVTKDHVIKDVKVANVDDDDEGNSTQTKDVSCSVHQVT